MCRHNTDSERYGRVRWHSIDGQIKDWERPFGAGRPISSQGHGAFHLSALQHVRRVTRRYHCLSVERSNMRSSEEKRLERL
jgi:hypothetical protein